MQKQFVQNKYEEENTLKNDFDLPPICIFIFVFYRRLLETGQFYEYLYNTPYLF